MSSSSSASGPMGRLIAYAQGHRQRVWAACVCSVLNKAFDLAPPVLIGAAVDIAVSREASWLGQAGIRDLSTQLSLLVVATIVIWGL
ncbi:MAG TPA: ABC transporter, partial [Myxococcales bacterium]|nr:ABC transporter [Myxococcales bacterium]